MEVVERGVDVHEDAVVAHSLEQRHDFAEVVVGRGAARAAFAPQAPWTPPPGWADDDARNRPGIGVSARASPATGRKTSCWWSWLVPPPIDPPSRLAFARCRSSGAMTWRARTTLRN